MRRDIIYLLIVVFVTALLLAWFFSDARSFKDDPEKINVVTTSYYLSDFSKEIGAENIDIINIVPIGQNPYEFKLSPFDRMTMRKADVLILSGGGLDSWADKIANGLSKEGILVLRMMDIFKKEGFLREDEKNPYIWLDPIFAKKEVSIISSAFVELDPKNKDKYNKNAQEYIRRIDFLDKDYKREMESCLFDEVPVSYDVFYYTAKRYGFKTSYIFDGDELGVSGFKMKVDKLLHDPVINFDFVDKFITRFSNGFLRVSFLENVRNDDLVSRKNYITLMRDNLNKIKEVRGCKDE